MEAEPRFDWKQLTASIIVEDGPKQYGKVKLPSGREITRNYGRELKNGKGFSWVDIVSEKIRSQQNNMLADIGRQVFNV